MPDDSELTPPVVSTEPEEEAPGLSKFLVDSAIATGQDAIQAVEGPLRAGVNIARSVLDPTPENIAAAGQTSQNLYAPQKGGPGAEQGPPNWAWDDPNWQAYPEDQRPLPPIEPFEPRYLLDPWSAMVEQMTSEERGDPKKVTDFASKYGVLFWDMIPEDLQQKPEYQAFYGRWMKDFLDDSVTPLLPENWDGATALLNPLNYLSEESRQEMLESPFVRNSLASVYRMGAQWDLSETGRALDELQSVGDELHRMEAAPDQYAEEFSSRFLSKSRERFADLSQDNPAVFPEGYWEESVTLNIAEHRERLLKRQEELTQKPETLLADMLNKQGLANELSLETRQYFRFKNAESPGDWAAGAKDAGDYVDLILGLGAESAAPMAATMGGSIAGGVAGGVPGIMAGTGASSFLVEYIARFQEELFKEVEAKHGELTLDTILKTLQDDESRQKAEDLARRGSGAIAVTEAVSAGISMGIAHKLLGPGRSVAGRIGRTGAALVTEQGIGSFAGGLGEYLAYVFQGKDPSTGEARKDIFAEASAEFLGAGAATVSATVSTAKAKSDIARERRSLADGVLTALDEQHSGLGPVESVLKDSREDIQKEILEKINANPDLSPTEIYQAGLDALDSRLTSLAPEPSPAVNERTAQALEELNTDLSDYTASLPEDQQPRATENTGRFLDRLAPFKHLFQGGVKFEATGAMPSYNPDTKTLTVDPAALPSLTDDRLYATAIEESLHIAVTDAAEGHYGQGWKGKMSELWTRLPAGLQDTVRAGYHAGAIREDALQAAAANQPAPAAPQGNDFGLMNEFVRMVLQDQDFAMQVTEEIGLNRGDWTQELWTLLTGLTKTIRQWLTTGEWEPQAREDLGKFLEAVKENPVYKELLGIHQEIKGLAQPAPTAETTTPTPAQANPQTPARAGPEPVAPSTQSGLPPSQPQPVADPNRAASILADSQKAVASLPAEKRPQAEQTAKAVSAILAQVWDQLFPGPNPRVVGWRFGTVRTSKDAAARLGAETIGFEIDKTRPDAWKLVIDLARLSENPRGTEMGYLIGQLKGVALFAHFMHGHLNDPARAAAMLRGDALPGLPTGLRPNVQDIPYLLKELKRSMPRAADWRVIANNLDTSIAQGKKNQGEIEEATRAWLENHHREAGRLYAAEVPDSLEIPVRQAQGIQRGHVVWQDAKPATIGQLRQQAASDPAMAEDFDHFTEAIAPLAEEGFLVLKDGSAHFYVGDTSTDVLSPGLGYLHLADIAPGEVDEFGGLLDNERRRLSPDQWRTKWERRDAEREASKTAQWFWVKTPYGVEGKFRTQERAEKYLSRFPEGGEVLDSYSGRYFVPDRAKLAPAYSPGIKKPNSFYVRTPEGVFGKFRTRELAEAYQEEIGQGEVLDYHSGKPLSPDKTAYSNAWQELRGRPQPPLQVRYWVDTGDGMVGKFRTREIAESYLEQVGGRRVVDNHEGPAEKPDPKLYQDAYRALNKRLKEEEEGSSILGAAPTPNQLPLRVFSGLSDYGRMTWTDGGNLSKAQIAKKVGLPVTDPDFVEFWNAIQPYRDHPGFLAFTGNNAKYYIYDHVYVQISKEFGFIQDEDPPELKIAGTSNDPRIYSPDAVPEFVLRDHGGVDHSDSPASPQQAADGDRLYEAYRHGRGVHGAVGKARVISPPEEGLVRAYFNYQVTGAEQRRLKKWAQEQGLLRPWEEYDRIWRERGQRHGGEHDIYILDGVAYKRQVATQGSNFDTYFDYFRRFLLHGALFPQTSYELVGFTEDPEGVLMPLVTQRAIEEAKDENGNGVRLDQSEIDAQMARDGFEKVGDFSYEKPLPDGSTIVVTDSHYPNVILPVEEAHRPIGERALAVIDPIIKIRRGDVESDLYAAVAPPANPEVAKFQQEIPRWIDDQLLDRRTENRAYAVAGALIDLADQHWSQWKEVWSGIRLATEKEMTSRRRQSPFTVDRAHGKLVVNLPRLLAEDRAADPEYLEAQIELQIIVSLEKRHAAEQKAWENGVSDVLERAWPNLFPNGELTGWRFGKVTTSREAAAAFGSDQVWFDIDKTHRKLVVDSTRLLAHPRGGDQKWIARQIRLAVNYAKTAMADLESPADAIRLLDEAAAPDLPFLFKEIDRRLKTKEDWVQVAEAFGISSEGRSKRELMELIASDLKAEKEESGELYAAVAPPLVPDNFPRTGDILGPFPSRAAAQAYAKEIKGELVESEDPATMKPPVSRKHLDAVKELSMPDVASPEDATRLQELDRWIAQNYLDVGREGLPQDQWQGETLSRRAEHHNRTWLRRRLEYGTVSTNEPVVQVMPVRLIGQIPARTGGRYLVFAPLRAYGSRWTMHNDPRTWVSVLEGAPGENITIHPHESAAYANKWAGEFSDRDIEMRDWGLKEVDISGSREARRGEATEAWLFQDRRLDSLSGERHRKALEEWATQGDQWRWNRASASKGAFGVRLTDHPSRGRGRVLDPAWAVEMPDGRIEGPIKFQDVAESYASKTGGKVIKNYRGRRTEMGPEYASVAKHHYFVRNRDAYSQRWQERQDRIKPNRRPYRRRSAEPAPEEAVTFPAPEETEEPVNLEAPPTQWHWVKTKDGVFGKFRTRELAEAYQEEIGQGEVLDAYQGDQSPPDKAVYNRIYQRIWKQKTKRPVPVKPKPVETVLYGVKMPDGRIEGPIRSLSLAEAYADQEGGEAHLQFSASETTGWETPGPRFQTLSEVWKRWGATAEKMGMTIEEYQDYLRETRRRLADNELHAAMVGIDQRHSGPAERLRAMTPAASLLAKELNVDRRAMLQTAGKLAEQWQPNESTPLSRAFAHEVMFRFAPEVGGVDLHAAVTPEQNADYMATVEAGDLAKAQEMVNTAAKKAGYAQGPVYHGSPSKTLEGGRFDPQRLGVNTEANSAKLGFFFVSDPTVAEGYAMPDTWFFGTPSRAELDAENALWWAEESGDSAQVEAARNSLQAIRDKDQQRQRGMVVNAYLKLSNPLEVDHQNMEYDEAAWTGPIQRAIEGGHDGVVMRNAMDAKSSTPFVDVHDIYVVFSPNQVKSADPVTRDEQGNVIPLSERFNPERDSILHAAETTPQNPETDTVSTRVPFSKKSDPSNALSEHLSVGVEAMPESYREKALDLMISLKNRKAGLYPALQGIKGKPRQKFEQVINLFAKNILWLYDQVPAEVRERSHLWYDGGRRIIDQWSQDYRLEPRQIAGVIAVLSPQKNWFHNMSLAERVLDIWTDQQETAWTPAMQVTTDRILGKPEYEESRKGIVGKRLSEVVDTEHKAAWIRVYDETQHSRWSRKITPEGTITDEVYADAKIGWGSFVSVAAAINIITDGSLANVSANVGQVHKVRNFYNNLIAPNSKNGSVTIDTHAIAAAHLMPYGGSATEVSHGLGAGVSHAESGLQGTYGIYAEAYRRAAQARGVLPREMQSITWEALRGMYSAVAKRDKNLIAQTTQLWQAYALGQASLEDTQNGLLALAQGIAPPPWANSVDQKDAQPQRPTYPGELSGGKLRRARLAGERAARDRGSDGDARSASGGVSAGEPANSGRVSDSTLHAAQPPRGPEDDGNLGELTTDEILAQELRALMEQVARDFAADPIQTAYHQQLDQALQEPSGQRTMGDPRYANPATDPRARVAYDVSAEAYREGISPETLKFWDQEGARWVATLGDTRAAARHIIALVMEGSQLNDAQTRGAMQIADKLWREAIASGNRDQIREARLFSWSYSASRTANARALAAGRDPLKTPAQRNLEYVTRFLTRLSPEAQQRVDTAGQQGSRYKSKKEAVEAEQDKQWARLETELNLQGLTLADIFQGEAIARLRNSPAVQRVIESVGQSEAEKLALRMILDRHTNASISKATGLPEGRLDLLESRFDAAILPIFEQWANLGLTLESLPDSALQAGPLQAAPATPAGDPAKAKQQARAILKNLKLDRNVRNAGRSKKLKTGPGLSGKGSLAFNLDETFHVVALARMIQAINGNAYDALLELYISDLLSGPMTQVYNVVGGTVNAAMEYLIRRPLETLVNSIPGLRNEQNSAGFTELSYIWQGLVPGLIDAWKKASLSFTHEFGLFESEKLNEPVVLDTLNEKGTGKVGLSETLFMQILGSEGFDAVLKRFGSQGIWTKYLKVRAEAVTEATEKLGMTSEAAAIYAEEKGRKAVEQSLAYQVQKWADKTGVSKVARGGFIRLPLRGLLFADQFIKYTIGNMEVGAQAYRIGKFRGLKGQELSDFIRDQVAKPGSEAWIQAVDKAQELTFTRQLRSLDEGGGFAEHMTRALQRWLNTPWKHLRPLQFLFRIALTFLSTPFQIFAHGLRGTPLSSGGILARGLYNVVRGEPIIDGGKARLVRHIADHLFGYGMMAPLLWLIVEGDDDDDEKFILLTGSHAWGSEKQGEMELNQRTEGGGLMLRIGGKGGTEIDLSQRRIPLGRFDPVSIQLATWSDSIRAIKRQQNGGLSREEALEMAIRSFRAQVSDKSYTQGVEDLANLSKDILDPEGNPGKAAVRFLRSKAAGFVPNVIRQPMRQLDDSVRATWERPWYYDFAPYSGFAEPKIDLYGNEVKRGLSDGNQRIFRVLVDAGFQPSAQPEEKFDSFLKSYLRVGLEWPDNLGFPTAKTRDLEYFSPLQKTPVKMTAEEARQYNERVGWRFAAQSRAKLTQWDIEHPSEEKLIEIVNLLSKTRQEVRREMFPSQRLYEKLSRAEKARLPDE